MDALITVTLGSKTKVIFLSGDELSRTVQPDGSTHRYLGNASKDFIAGEVEKALVEMTEETDGAI